MKSVAVIGAGIFGTTIALALSKRFKVSLFERETEIMLGASTNNHLRYHYGYHYPRSKKTALESIRARKSFENEYGACISKIFPAYYGISKKGTKTNPKEFLKFCDEMGLPYVLEFPEKIFMDRTKIDLCVRVPETVYDPSILNGIIMKKIKNSTVQLKLGCEIRRAEIKSDKKILIYKTGNIEKKEEYDFVVSSIYYNFNKINSWFGFPKKKVLYELVELLEIKLPVENKIGLTIIDGEFSSVLPRGEKGTFTLGHVKESVLKQVVSDDLQKDLILSENIYSNKKEILRAGALDFPIIDKAEFVRSIFVTRVVKANVDDTDERPTEITEHGNGIYSIFGGKVVTCVDTAKKIIELLQ